MLNIELILSRNDVVLYTDYDSVITRLADYDCVVVVWDSEKKSCEVTDAKLSSQDSATLRRS